MAAPLRAPDHPGPAQAGLHPTPGGPPLTDRPDLSYPIPEDRIPAAVFAITCGALGYPRGVVPPPPVAAFATAMRSAIEAQLAAPASGNSDAPGDPLRKASAGAVFAPVANLARLGLLPGTPAAPGTGYLYAQNRSLTGRPTPLGRVRMAFAAGADVETIPVGRACLLTMGQDGLVGEFARDPDNVPRKWEDLRGVVVSVTSHASGLLKMHWVSAGEIDDRRQRAQGKGKTGAWASDPVAMARAKAIHIIGDRGGFPQVPIPIPGLREWQAAQAGALLATAPQPAAPPARALPAPAEPTTDAPATPVTDAPPAVPQAPEAAPTDAPDPTPADDATPAQDAPSAPQGGGTEAQVAPAPPVCDWDDVGIAVMGAVRAARPNRAGDGDDLHAATTGAITEALHSSASKGRLLTPAAALDPKALDRLTAMAVARLDAM